MRCGGRGDGDAAVGLGEGLDVGTADALGLAVACAAPPHDARSAIARQHCAMARPRFMRRLTAEGAIVISPSMMEGSMRTGDSTSHLRSGSTGT
jgi:hypothetical protein